jgi:hypothetical protein
LRLIPAIEAGAIGHLEGLRQRGTGTLTGPLRTAASFALHEGLQADGTARLMGKTAAGGALGSGGAGGSGAGGDGSGGAGSGARAISDDPESGGMFTTPGDLPDKLMASGKLEPRPKGPKPIVGWSESSDGGGGAESGSGSGDDDHPAPSPASDAWKWRGVPPGRRFLYPVQPGKHRFYIDYDHQGPKMVGLPPAWPTDDAEDDG